VLLARPAGCLHNSHMETAPEPVYWLPPEDTDPTGSPPIRLLDAARGFASLFWGLLACLLLFPGELDLRLGPQLRLPMYPAGMIAVYCGLSLLNRAGPLRPRWPATVRQAQFALVLLFYFIPFVAWWEEMPRKPLFLLNMTGMAVTVAWLLAAILRLCELSGELFGDRLFRAEARLCRWLVLLLAAPVAAGFLAGAWLAGSYPGVFWMAAVTIRVLFWMVVLSLLPFTLTLTMTWRAKELCFAAAQTPPASAAVPRAPEKQVTSPSDCGTILPQ
jgi:hypothetical protein